MLLVFFLCTNSLIFRGETARKKATAIIIRYIERKSKKNSVTETNEDNYIKKTAGHVRRIKKIHWMKDENRLIDLVIRSQINLVQFENSEGWESWGPEHQTFSTPPIYLMSGNSPAVQQLGLRTFTAEGPGSIPDEGTNISQATH